MRSTLISIHKAVLTHFKEKPDRGEQWTMPPASYNGTQTIADDCDGFCLAVRQLLRQRNIPSRLVYCEIKGVGHLVVEAKGWILDNRQKSVMANTLLTALGYEFKRISGFNPGDPWYEIVSY
ncbi:MAG: hypothetical protein COA42_16310 [Alteromonadaceae bacterium]|nr:MAG: hypothetical protein COA42_16310 [Alteromonadaceae bacterium]